MKKKWVNQIDDPLNNRKARRHGPKKHNKRGYTKSSKKERR